METGQLIQYPKLELFGYKKYVASVLSDVQKKIKKDLVSQIPSFERSNLLNKDHRIDDYVDDIQRICNKLENEIELEDILMSASILFFANKLLRFSKTQLKRSIKTIKEDDFNDLFTIDQITKSFVASNLKLLKLYSKIAINESAVIVETALRDGKSYNSIKEEVNNKLSNISNRASFVAGDQILKLHSSYLKYKLKKEGYNEYIWVTMEDDRVRKTHAVLNQKICSWDNPYIYKKNSSEKKWRRKSSINGVPKQVGEDFNCRCGFIPIISK